MTLAEFDKINIPLPYRMIERIRRVFKERDELILRCEHLCNDLILLKYKQSKEYKEYKGDNKVCLTKVK
jgi:hypothetical protein